MLIKTVAMLGLWCMLIKTVTMFYNSNIVTGLFNIHLIPYIATVLINIHHNSNIVTVLFNIHLNPNIATVLINIHHNSNIITVIVRVGVC
jgi:hypothetical protein